MTSLGGKKFETQTVLNADWKSGAFPRPWLGAVMLARRISVEGLCVPAGRQRRHSEWAASQKTADEETELFSKVPLPKVETLLGIYYSPHSHVVLSQ